MYKLIQTSLLVIPIVLMCLHIIACGQIGE